MKQERNRLLFASTVTESQPPIFFTIMALHLLAGGLCFRNNGPLPPPPPPPPSPFIDSRPAPPPPPVFFPAQSIDAEEEYEGGGAADLGEGVTSKIVPLLPSELSITIYPCPLTSRLCG